MWFLRRVAHRLTAVWVCVYVCVCVALKQIRREVTHATLTSARRRLTHRKSQPIQEEALNVSGGTQRVNKIKMRALDCARALACSIVPDWLYLIVSTIMRVNCIILMQYIATLRWKFLMNTTINWQRFPTGKRYQSYLTPRKKSSQEIHQKCSTFCWKVVTGH